MHKEIIFRRLDLSAGSAGTLSNNSVLEVTAWCAMHAAHSELILQCIGERIASASTSEAQRTALVYVIHELLLTCATRTATDDARQRLLAAVVNTLPAAVSAVVADSFPSSDTQSFKTALEKALDWWSRLQLFPSVWTARIRSMLQTEPVSLPDKLSRLTLLMSRYQESKRKWKASAATDGSREEALRHLRLVDAARRQDFPSFSQLSAWCADEMGTVEHSSKRVKLESDSLFSGEPSASTAAHAMDAGAPPDGDDVLGSFFG